MNRPKVTDVLAAVMRRIERVLEGVSFSTHRAIVDCESCFTWGFFAIAGDVKSFTDPL